MNNISTTDSTMPFTHLAKHATRSVSRPCLDDPLNFVIPKLDYDGLIKIANHCKKRFGGSVPDCFPFVHGLFYCIYLCSLGS